MQVFVPDTDFSKCAYFLDSKRLNKQILEACQLLDILLNKPTMSGKLRTGWLNHPALLAWKDCGEGLFTYTLACINEAKKRGIKTSTYETRVASYNLVQSGKKPIWWNDEKIHSSHRSRLLQKGWEEKFKKDDRNTTIEWYRQWNWAEMSDPMLMSQEYLWPTNITNIAYDTKICVGRQATESKELLIKKFGQNPYLKP